MEDEDDDEGYCKNVAAEGVSRILMERFEAPCRESRVVAMRGSLMVATEPVAQRRRWCFLSWVWDEARSGGGMGRGGGSLV